MGKVHVTHVRSNRRGASKPFTVVCSCNWKMFAESMADAKDRGQGHKQAEALMRKGWR